MGKRKTEEEALEKAYLVKAHNPKATSGYILLPPCMIGKRIKIDYAD